MTVPPPGPPPVPPPVPPAELLLEATLPSHPSPPEKMERPSGRILIVDDEENARSALAEMLADEGYETRTAEDGQAALETLERFPAEVILTDLKMPRLDGLGLLEEGKKRMPHAAFVVMTAFGSIDTAVKAIKRGAENYLTKPLDMDAVSALVARAMDRAKLGAEAAKLREQVGHRLSYEGILGDHPTMQRVLKTVGQVARSKATVLIQGESGTGKELIAAAIHHNSKRSDGPFVKLNCAALAESLLESELFGHERGSFTGAQSRRAGRFEQAHGGTLFLDEVGELPLDMQTRLLRVLQEGEVRPVGSTETLTLDLRFVAATHVDLTEAVRAGRFREDLFYWLQGAVLSVPPLRERVEDIAPLAERFLVEAARLAGRARVPALSEEARRALEAHGWPGNVRQLRNVVQRAVLLGGGDVVELADLDVPAAEEAASPVDLRTALEAFEKERIRDALEATGGNQTLAAKRLGVARRTLISRIEKYGLPRPRKGSDE